ncbi:MAG: phosphatidylglycerophosphatase A [Saprospiraceae bacterium]|nr:phosphatidylglycerophosphatase A [Saprospiraceae bacterium]
MKNFYRITATGFGTGKLPIAPGTWGAALAALLAAPLMWADSNLARLVLIVAAVALSFICARAADMFADEWGEDPSRVVADEMVGMWVTLVGNPLTWGNIGLGFLFFRFFDIAKPLGVRRLERIPGGWGVVLDDVLAGVYANILLQLVNLCFALPYF